MRGDLCSTQEVYKKVPSIWMVLIVVLLSTMFVAACDTPGINNNGNNNGVNNGNYSPSNSCNGVNNCTTINNSSSGSGLTSGGGTTQQQPSGGSGPIAEGDFLYNPGSVSGPAIVEYWNGQGGAGRVCGTFQLPSGESFNYNAGHWWKYNSDQDMQAQWTEHVALYQQKSENAGCSIGQRPS